MNSYLTTFRLTLDHEEIKPPSGVKSVLSKVLHLAFLQINAITINFTTPLISDMDNTLPHINFVLFQIK